MKKMVCCFKDDSKMYVISIDNNVPTVVVLNTEDSDATPYCVDKISLVDEECNVLFDTLNK